MTGGDHDARAAVLQALAGGDRRSTGRASEVAAEALAEPVRIVRNLHKINEFTDADAVPGGYAECLQTIFSVNGVNTPLTPGATVEFEMPDWYGRPWATIWEQYFEEGMSKPEEDGDLFSFD